MKEVTKDFPILRETTYLNTAVFGPLHNGLITWRREYDRKNQLGGSHMWGETLKILAATREAIGGFFNCEERNVALVYNFSIGLNLLLEGLDSKKKVLMLQDDYPSLNWPFESRGFKTKVLKGSKDIESRIEEAVRTEHIDVFAFSLVQWLDGFTIDPEFIKGLKRTYPDLLIIADGTQFCGASSFDFKASGIDVMGASGYKWMLAGYGNGFMLFGDGVEDRFAVPTLGFHAANGSYDQKEAITFAQKFEPGHLSGLTFGSLGCSLSYLTHVGMDKITAYNQHLANQAKQELAALDLLDEHVVARKTHSGIFKMKVDHTMFQKLQENGIVCSERGNGVRISFNFYNTEADLAKLVGIIKAHG